MDILCVICNGYYGNSPVNPTECYLIHIKGREGRRKNERNVIKYWSSNELKMARHLPRRQPLSLSLSLFLSFFSLSFFLLSFFLHLSFFIYHTHTHNFSLSRFPTLFYFLLFLLFFFSLSSSLFLPFLTSDSSCRSIFFHCIHARTPQLAGDLAKVY